MRGLIIVIAIIIVAIIAIAIWNSSQNSSAQNQSTNQTNNQTSSSTTTGTTSGTSRQMTVTLNSENNSGESGSATITDQNGQMLVAVNIKGEPSGASQPMHFHMGICNAVGAIRYPLNSVVNGSSTTLLNVSYDTFLTQLPLIINVHKSAAQSNVHVACGTVNVLNTSSTTSSSTP